MHEATIAALLAGCVLLGAAALHDIATRTVPNGLAALIAAAGLLVQLLGGTALHGLPAAFLVFVLAALAWRRGWMGGGDVKLLGAAALLVPPGLVPSLVAAVALSGGLLGIVYLVARRRGPAPGSIRPPPSGLLARTPKPDLLARAVRAERWRMRRGGPMPYAVAIAGGTLFILTHGGLP